MPIDDITQLKRLVVTKIGFLMVVSPPLYSLFAGPVEVTDTAASAVIFFMVAGGWLSGWGYGRLSMTTKTDKQERL